MFNGGPVEWWRCLPENGRERWKKMYATLTNEKWSQIVHISLMNKKETKTESEKFVSGPAIAET